MTTHEASVDRRPATGWAEVMLLAVALVWGASYGLAKTAVLFYPVLGVLAVRFCITSLLLQPALSGLPRRQAAAVFKVGLPLGLILLAIFISETYGLSLTRASNAAFLTIFRAFLGAGLSFVAPEKAISDDQSRLRSRKGHLGATPYSAASIAAINLSGRSSSLWAFRSRAFKRS